MHLARSSLPADLIGDHSSPVVLFGGLFVPHRGVERYSTRSHRSLAGPSKSPWNLLCAARFSDNPAMTAAGKHILEDFETLPDVEKREVLADLLRISRDIAYPDISDEELLAAANEVFLEYDRREAE